MAHGTHGWYRSWISRSFSQATWAKYKSQATEEERQHCKNNSTELTGWWRRPRHLSKWQGGMKYYNLVGPTYLKTTWGEKRLNQSSPSSSQRRRETASTVNSAASCSCRDGWKVHSTPISYSSSIQTRDDGPFLFALLITQLTIFPLIRITSS